MIASSFLPTRCPSPSSWAVPAGCADLAPARVRTEPAVTGSSCARGVRHPSVPPTATQRSRGVLGRLSPRGWHTSCNMASSAPSRHTGGRSAHRRVQGSEHTERSGATMASQPPAGDSGYDQEVVARAQRQHVVTPSGEIAGQDVTVMETVDNIEARRPHPNWITRLIY